ncbi:gephyrin-like molybdotransferase receptor GlpR [Embleya sp. NPDC059237]|uniref:divisome protein SepX/GlpR n=1 Tax=Embleya sp. NPDC059237 TaxID=3346784 RepID=UPI003677ADFB
MNGSGLIYAAIVGAWAAYLVPMWLRRQDELNEARPTERFTTAIRILSRRGAFERRSARALAEKSGTEGAERRAAGESGRGRRPSGTAGAGPGVGAQASGAQGSGGQASSAQASVQAPAGQSSGGQSSVPQQATGSGAGSAAAAKGKAGGAGKRPAAPVRRDEGRAALLTRRRRVIASLFAGFTAGAILAGVAGLAWVWLPAVPGVLLSAYIVHLRVQERRRYEAGLRRLGRPAGKPGTPADAGAAHEARVRAARTREAADGATADPRPATPPTAGEGRQVRTPRSGSGAPGASGPAGAGGAAGPAGSARGRRERAEEEPALAEWIAELATGDGPDRDAWDPVPVPLPTYVTAPVVPRGDTEQEPERPQIHAVPDPQPAEALRPPTPLFDQYAEDTRTGYGASVDSLPLYEHEWRRAGNE